jgi:hypothetical protein
MGIMNVPSEYLTLIVDEMNAVEAKWDAAATPEEKLYYFSAVFGTINRVMNFHTDPVLVLVHQVLQTAHRSVVTRLSAPKPPRQEAFLGVPDEMIDAVLSATKDLRHAFEMYALGQQADNETWNAIKKFASIGYAATGNGFYLYKRGNLKI